MKKIIFVCIFIIILITTACENKMNEKAIFEPKDIQQVKPIEPIEQPQEQGAKEQEPQNQEPQEQQKSDLQWPKDFIPGLPLLQGEISSLKLDVPREGDDVQEPQYARIELINIEESVADQFIEELKDSGYTENAIYEKNEFITKYYVQELNAENNGCRVYFKWNPVDNSAFAVLLKPGWLALSAYLFFYDDTAEDDLSPWPENFLPNFPEPKGKIIDVTCSEVDTDSVTGINYSITLYYSDRQSVLDCIEELKKRYIVEADEEITDNFLMYHGYSKYYDNGKFDAAYIGFEDISNSDYIKMLEAPEGKFKIISVSMTKSK
jgi:hypothetical protein